MASSCSTSATGERDLTAARVARQRAAVLAAVFLFYAGAVVWLTWPLAARLGSELPNTHPACNFDLFQTAWVLAHESRALTEAPATLANAPIYHPASGALFYADAAFGALPFFLPPFVLSGNPTLSVNLAFLIPAALTALALHAVTRAWTGSHLAGLVAGWTFLTTRWTFWEFVPTAPQYAGLFWFPFVIALAARPPSRRRDLGLAALIALQSLASPVYVSAAILGPLGVLALARLARPAARVDGLRLLGAMALALLLLAPVAAGYVAVRVANPDLAEQSYWRWWHPTTDLPWGPISGPQVPTAVPLVAIAVAVAGFVSWALPWRGGAAPAPSRVFGHALFWSVVGIVMGMAPDATWYGRPIRIPHTLLAEWIPLYRTLRESFRLGIAGLMGLSLAAGLGFALSVARLPGRGRAAAFGATLLALVVGGEMYREYRAPGDFGREPLPPEYPLLRPPAAADPLVQALTAGQGPVLEVPVGLTQNYGCVPGYHALAMYRAIFHRRPLLNGYGGYWPDGFIERMQLAAALPDGAALAALREQTGLTTVVVNMPSLNATKQAAWRRTLAEGAPAVHQSGSYDDAIVLDVRGE
jgi:hypothetical protein